MEKKVWVNSKNEKGRELARLDWMDKEMEKDCGGGLDRWGGQKRFGWTGLWKTTG